MLDGGIDKHGRAGRGMAALLAGLLFGACLSRDATAAALRSPWDARPPDAAALSAAPCPQVPSLPAGISAADYYLDSARSIADPQRKQAYDEAVGVLRDAAEEVVALADRYRETGDMTAARCAADWLDSFARKGVLSGPLTTNQAVYVQRWMLGAFAVVALKIRASGEGSDTRGRIAGWLAGVAEQQAAYYGRRVGKIDGRNNHRYWAGFAVMAAGIAAGRPDLFDWGVASFRLGAAQVTPEGTLPLEMERRARALHYHLFAAAPLVMMAELALANGVDLYAENDRALARLLHRVLAGTEDPTFFARQAGIAQEPIVFTAGDVAWAAPYASRFRDPEITRVVARARSAAFLYVGGRPPSVAQ